LPVYNWRVRILIVHNAYRHPGGEDTCVSNEFDALRGAGHDVRLFAPQSPAGLGAIVGAIKAPFGGGAVSSLGGILRDWTPEVLHAHNLFPLLSPRIFKDAKARGVVTVQTLHNFRPLCLNGLFMTPSLEVCERCPTQESYRPGILRGCYRKSPAQSSALAAHLSLADSQDWYDHVDRFIAPSEFLKEKYVRYGFPSSRITVQGHFVRSTAPEGASPAQPYVLYLGRLSEEKGVRWLLSLFGKSNGPMRLVTAGSGPLEAEVRAAEGPFCHWAGRVEGELKRKWIREATAIVLASECYENFPLAVAEGNVEGTPAIVARQGGMAELVREGETGETFTLHNETDFWFALSRLQSRVDRSRVQQSAERFSERSFLRERTALYQSMTEKSAVVRF
jgi:glycosyltransferase involved in cell wall biosynthesis